jgi:hypothetical protein
VARPGWTLTADALVAEFGRHFYSERFREERELLASAHQQEHARLAREILLADFRREQALLASAHRREAARLGRQLRSRGKRRAAT